MVVGRTLAAGWLASVLFAGPLPTPTPAASPTRIDRFDLKRNRTGAAVVERHRIDFFDARNNRTGSGWIRDGEVETFDRKGNRTGVGRWPAVRER